MTLLEVELEGTKRINTGVIGYNLDDHKGNPLATEPLQAQLEQNEQKPYEKMSLLNIVPTPVMIVDREFNVQLMNLAGARAVARTPEACVGQKCYSLFKTKHCNTHECQVAKAMQQDDMFTSQTVANLHSGEYAIRSIGAPVKDPDGKIIGGLEIMLDITDDLFRLVGIAPYSGK